MKSRWSSQFRVFVWLATGPVTCCVWVVMALAAASPKAWAVYDEPLRPLFHYSTPSGWSGDPCGMEYYNGEYHFCYQLTPNSLFADFGQMNWGNAVSSDLVHWQNLPIALSPDSNGSCWDGTTVVDWNNSAGFGAQAMITTYTAAGNPFGQRLAYSLDRGRSWTKWGLVLGDQGGGSNHDPQVSWYAPQNKWVMALYLHDNLYGFYSSTDLKNWSFLSTFNVPGVIEVPSLFPMPLNGNTNDIRWIFYCGGGVYHIGTFDGTTYTKQVGPINLNEGNSYTAAQTFNDMPASDGRRILISQGVQHFPGMPWENYYNFPVELSLRNTNGFVIHANPAREISQLRLNARSWPAQALSPGANIMGASRGEAFEIDATFTPGTSTHIGFILRGQMLLYETATHRVFCNGLWRFLDPVNGVINLHILVDRGVIEMYGNDGRLYMPVAVEPKSGVLPVGMFVGGGGASLISLKKYDLKSIWQ